MTGSARSTYGTYSVTEAFVEIRAPLIEDRLFATLEGLLAGPRVESRNAEDSRDRRARAQTIGMR